MRSSDEITKVEAKTAEYAAERSLPDTVEPLGPKGSK